MTFTTMAKYWKRLTTELRRGDMLDAYAAVVETQKRGALHLHVLLTGNRRISNKRKRNKKTGKLEDSDLFQLCERVGFGQADIRAVEPSKNDTPERVAYYHAKDLCHYLTAKKAEALAEKAGSRVRPFRLSQGKRTPFSSEFPTLKAAEEHLAERIRRDIAETNGEDPGERDAGPWVMAVKRADGSVQLLREGDKEKVSLAKRKQRAERERVKRQRQRARAKARKRAASDGGRRAA